MAELKSNAPRAGRNHPNEAVRSAAYGAGFVAGGNAAAARADVSRREMAVVLGALGDSIAVGERADMIAWYGVVSRVFAGVTGEFDECSIGIAE